MQKVFRLLEDGNDFPFIDECEKGAKLEKRYSWQGTTGRIKKQMGCQRGVDNMKVLTVEVEI